MEPSLTSFPTVGFGLVSCRPYDAGISVWRSNLKTSNLKTSTHRPRNHAIAITTTFTPLRTRTTMKRAACEDGTARKRHGKGGAKSCCQEPCYNTAIAGVLVS